jgi:superfamily II DNA or RNA helicase
MKLVLDLATVDGYRTFLKVKALPVYSFRGREASFPDEYADRLGVAAPAAPGREYRPAPRLFDYQADIARTAITRRKFAVFADCGLGKTLIMLEYVRHIAAALPPGRAVLIVSPLMVVRQTIEEGRRFYGDALPVEQVRAAGLNEWLDRGDARVGITNYEAITDDVRAGRLGALVLDESSLLKSHYGKWGTRLIELGRGLDWKLCLTGTPAPNDRIEYANHAVFLDQFPTTNAFLARFFVNRGETANRWELKPHALRSFYRSLSHWCIFLTRPGVYGWKDNAGDLPPVRVHIEDVPLSDSQTDAAMDLTKSLFAGAAGGIGQRQKLARIAKGDDGHKPGRVVEIVRRSPDPCIVWCKYNPEQEGLAERMPDAADVTGETPEDRRLELIGDFQSGRRTVLISKPKILGFGLNLQVANRMVFSTVQDSYEEYYQAVKRANRYGSTRPLDVYIPVTELERPMLDTVLAKAARVQADAEEQEALFLENRAS